MQWDVSTLVFVLIKNYSIQIFNLITVQLHNYFLYLLTIYIFEQSEVTDDLYTILETKIKIRIIRLLSEYLKVKIKFSAVQFY